MGDLLDTCDFDRDYDNYIIHNTCGPDKFPYFHYTAAWGPTRENGKRYNAHHNNNYVCPTTHLASGNKQICYQGASDDSYTIIDTCDPIPPPLNDDTAKLRCCLRGAPVPENIIIPKHDWIGNKFTEGHTVATKTYAEGDSIGYCPRTWCPTTSTCNDFMKGYCGKNWDSLCDLYVNDLIEKRPEEARDFAQLVLKKYKKPAKSPGALSIDDAVTHNKLADLCKKLPGLGNETLETYCSGLTRNDLTNNRGVRRLCGCYLPPKEYPYARWFDFFCDPVCIVEDTVKKGYSQADGTWSELLCQSTNCVIDDVSIKIIDSVVDTVELKQICPGCDGACTCFISGDTLIDSSHVTGGIDYTQLCSSCIDPVSGEPCVKPKPDPDVDPDVDPDENPKESWWKRYRIWLVGVGALVTILFLVIYLIS